MYRHVSACAGVPAGRSRSCSGSRDRLCGRCPPGGCGRTLTPVLPPVAGYRRRSAQGPLRGAGNHHTEGSLREQDQYQQAPPSSQVAARAAARRSTRRRHHALQAARRPFPPARCRPPRPRRGAWPERSPQRGSSCLAPPAPHQPGRPQRWLTCCLASAGASCGSPNCLMSLSRPRRPGRQCPLRTACLAGVLERAEPCGVWGGEIFHQGAIIARKRPRGRPPRTRLDIGKGHCGRPTTQRGDHASVHPSAAGC